jgi:hypothetical protein
MANPVVHALAFIAAVLIPGGLLIYFAWRATRSISFKGEPNHTAQNQGFDVESPTPDEALNAFLEAFPKYPQDSLRARNRSKRLHRYKTRPKKKSQ